jgi:hypothetical protein
MTLVPYEPTMPWDPPTECDMCPHPISEHQIWPPDWDEDGWMMCAAKEPDNCWHSYPMGIGAAEKPNT